GWAYMPEVAQRNGSELIPETDGVDAGERAGDELAGAIGFRYRHLIAIGLHHNGDVSVVRHGIRRVEHDHVSWRWHPRPILDAYPARTHGIQRPEIYRVPRRWKIIPSQAIRANNQQHTLDIAALPRHPTG